MAELIILLKEFDAPLVLVLCGVLFLIYKQNRDFGNYVKHHDEVHKNIGGKIEENTNDIKELKNTMDDKFKRVHERLDDLYKLIVEKLK